MATQLFLIDTASDIAADNGGAVLVGGASQWNTKQLATARGGGVNATFAMPTVDGATAGIEVGASATVRFDWLTPPLDADVTISGTVTLNIWASESNMSANVAINAQIDKVDGATGAIASVLKTARTTEVAVTTRAANNFTDTPTSTAFKRGDRIRVRIFGDDAGTMATGFTFNASYDGTSAAADGDTYVTFTENLTFVSEPAGSQVFPTDTASDVATASVDREAWTSRGAGVATDVTNTAAGWTAGIHTTDTAGGTVVDWFTKPLAAFTLGGAVRVNLRALESNSLANAQIGVQLAVVDNDGTNAVAWAAGSAFTTVFELGTTESARSFLVAGDDVAITDGQRIRIRLLVDDSPVVGPLVTGHTVTTYYAGADGATGDTFLTFTQTLTEASSGTNAPAGNAAGTGASSNPAASLSPTSQASAGTGVAHNATTTSASQVEAEHVTGTGAAFGATTALAPTEQVATGTGAALDASVSGDEIPEVPPGTGEAYDVTSSISTGSAASAGTGAAHNPSATLVSQAGAATGTGASHDATVSVAVATEAQAETASGTGAAHNLGTLIAFPAERAAGTGAAANATSSATEIPDTALGTGEAYNLSASVAPVIEAGAGTGAAYDAAPTSATVTSADAGHASGTGAASNPSASLAASSGTGTGTGAANGTAGNVSVGPTTATGTGAASDLTGAVQASVEAAEGTGAAHDAITASGNFTVAQPETANGSGAASDPTITAVDGGVVVTPPVTGAGGFVRRRQRPFRPSSNVIEFPSISANVYPTTAWGYGDAYNAHVEWDDDEYALSLLLEVA